MKQILLILALLCTLPIFAQDYSDYLSSAKNICKQVIKKKQSLATMFINP